MAGKNNNDRELASEVRSLCLNEIKEIFEFKRIKSNSPLYDPELNIRMAEMKKQLILKMSTSILPRLNELSGPDGGDIPLPIYGGKSNATTENK